MTQQTVLARGIPREFLRLTNAKRREIEAAYAQIGPKEDDA